MTTLMESVTNCEAKSDQEYIMNLSAAGDINIGKIKVDMKSI